MANSLYQQLNNSSVNQLASLYKQLKVSNNPIALLTNICQNNPNMQSVLAMIQNSNKNPQELFYEIAKQKGVDPNTILNMLK